MSQRTDEEGTPGFERMDRAMAQRHLRVRGERIMNEVLSMPTAEILRLAGDLVEKGCDEAARWAVEAARARFPIDASREAALYRLAARRAEEDSE